MSKLIRIPILFFWPILSRFEFFVDVGFQPGIGEAEFKVPELQAVLDEHICNPVKRVGGCQRHADGERNKSWDQSIHLAWVSLACFRSGRGATHRVLNFLIQPSSSLGRGSWP